MNSVEVMQSFMVILSVSLVPGVVGGVLLHLSHKNNWVQRVRQYYNL